MSIHKVSSIFKFPKKCLSGVYIFIEFLCIYNFTEMSVASKQTLGFIHLIPSQNVPGNQHFLLPRTYVGVPGCNKF